MARTKKITEPRCVWTDDVEFYETDCGEAFTFESAGPVENKFAFCPYCGRRVKARACK